MGNIFDRLDLQKIFIVIIVVIGSTLLGQFAGRGQYQLLAFPALGFAGILFLSKPRWAFYFFIFLIPLEWQIRLLFGAGMYRLVGIGVFGIWVLNKLIFRKKFESGPLDIPMVMLVSLIAFSFFYSSDTSLWTAGIQTYIQLVAFVLMTRDQIQDDQNLKMVFAIYIAGATIGSIITINEYLTYDNWEFYRRASGSAGDANTSSLSYIFGLPIIIYWITNNFKWYKIGGVGLVGLMVLATFVTISRTGLIVLAVALVLYAISVSYRSLGIKKTITMGLVFLILLLPLNNFIPWENITYRFDVAASAEGGEELGGRISTFSIYFQAISDNPILGYGINSRLFYASHNHLIDIAFHLGLIGLLIQLGIWRIVWNSIGKAIESADQHGFFTLRNFFLSFRVTVICLFIFSMTLSNGQSQLLWLTFALAEKCYLITKPLQNKIITE